MDTQHFRKLYTEAFIAFVNEREEELFAKAEELGCAMVHGGVPHEEIDDIHGETLKRLTAEFPDSTSLELVERFSAPLMELLMAYGLAFQEQAEERKRAAEELDRRTQDLTAFNALGQRVNASLTLTQVTEASLDAFVAPIAPDLDLIFIREGDKLILQGTVPPNSTLQHDATPAHRLGECLCGLAAREGKAVYSSNEDRDILRRYESGCNAFVRKAVDFSEFMKAIMYMGLFWMLLNSSPQGQGGN